MRGDTPPLCHISSGHGAQLHLGTVLLILERTQRDTQAYMAVVNDTG
jgi:hypothetical protein